jgi:hypothetical protein
LESLRDVRAHDDALRDVQERIGHLRLRESLIARSRVGRLSLVFRELLAGRYHRYGRGALSAAKDVVA